MSKETITSKEWALDEMFRHLEDKVETFRIVMLIEAVVILGLIVYVVVW